MTDRTGPKISSWPIRSIGRTPAKIVGSKKWPFGQAVAGRTAAADDEVALAAPDLDVGRDLVGGARVDERADVDRGVEAGAETELARPRLEALEQRLDDRPFDDHPRRGRAALAGRAEGRPEDPVGGEVEVRVGEHDDAVLAAELERDALEPAAGAARRCACRSRTSR